LQVEREFASAAPTLRVGCYYGGTPIGPQLRELRSGVEVVVGTPGRIIDLIDQDALDLGRVSQRCGGSVYLCLRGWVGVPACGCLWT
jgi:superfamily II DNA/RNA helicase